MFFNLARFQVERFLQNWPTKYKLILYLILGQVKNIIYYLKNEFSQLITKYMNKMSHQTGIRGKLAKINL